MIKKIIPAILFLAQMLSPETAYCQNSDNITARLREKFTSYVKAVPREEVYVQTDREEYISGEDVWFNVFLLDRSTFKPSESKIAYFELLNSENRPIIQKKIYIDGGHGPGQIILPDTLGTGVYTIRAYTSWMKNFLPFNCFTEDIKVYNSFTNKQLKEKSVPEKLNNESTFTRFFKEGLAMRIKKQENNFIDVIVTANQKYRSENGNIFYMFIQTHGNIDYINQERIKNDETIISIPANELSPGINHVTLFSSKGNPVCERFNYTPEKEEKAVVLHSVDSLSLRSKVSVEMDAAASGNGSPSIFSVAVAPKTNSNVMNIDDYLVFGSEFGFLPGIVIKGNKISSLPGKVIDSLLYNVKSNWINWNAILADELPAFTYLPEKEECFLSGRLLTGTTKAPDKNKYVVLSTPGKNAMFQYALTDQEGYFTFSLHIDEKVNDLIIQPESASKDQIMRIESQFSDQYSKPAVLLNTAANANPPYISAWSVNNQVRKIYGTSTSGGPLTPVIQRPLQQRFYGKPDIELHMKDYITLPVMQEVFFELLPGVGLKKKKAGYELTMNDPLTNQQYEKSPILFIDGVLVQDPSLAAAIDPENVERIEVIKQKYFVGDYRFFGLVNIITKAGDFSGTSLQDYAVRLNFRPVDAVLSFVSPDYTSSALKKNRIPDFRNTLYWNPSAACEKSGHCGFEFWTSDFVTEYEIKVQGINTDGKPFSCNKIVKVVRK